MVGDGRSLSSAAGQRWYARADAVDPAELSRRFEALPPAAQERFWAEGWKPVETPGNAARQLGLPLGKNRVWLATAFALQDPQGPPLALVLGVISDADRVYLNGRLVGGLGDRASPRPQAYDRQRIYTPADFAFRRQGANLLLIEITGYFPHEAGLVRDEIRLAPASSAIAAYYRSNILQGLFLMVYLTVAGYFSFLFVRRRQNRENLYFALFCLGLVVYQFLRTQLKYVFTDDLFLLKRIEYVTLFLLPNLFYLFLRRSFVIPEGAARRWLDRMILAPMAVHALMIGFVFWSDDVIAWDLWNRRIILPGWLIVYMPLMFGLVLYQAIWRRERDAIYLTAGLAMFMAAASVDMVGHLLQLNTPRIFVYAFLLFVVTVALILANRFVRLNEAVEDLNRNLERKVAERTEQLAGSLNEIRQLKVQQDGDYFLTSLLIRPLSGGGSESELVQIESRTIQKKRFQFRHWESDIGGDLCAAADVVLRGRRYVAFLNGDAMGKSIQGAGGALVLGALFKSIVARNAAREELQARSPEQWLRQSFHELSDVFQSFDGFMLVSVAMGLVDERSGFVYFLNADHPPPAIYSHGEARFVHPEQMYYKLGIPGEGSFYLRSFLLDSNHVLFLGSDGRDDLILSEDRSGRILNEDETLFLRAVEAASGSLDALIAELRRRGVFSDDLSLMRISYREGVPPPERPNAPRVVELLAAASERQSRGDHEGAWAALLAAQNLDPESPPALRARARYLMRRKDFVSAARTWLLLETVGAADHTLLIAMGRCRLRFGDLEGAGDCFDRARIQLGDRWLPALYQFVAASAARQKDAQRFASIALNRGAGLRHLARAERIRDALLRVREIAQSAGDQVTSA